MTNKTYDILKYIQQIVLPALATLYVGLAKFWNFPFPTEIAGTIMLVDAFMGVLLKLESNAYYKSGRDTDGVLMIDPNGDTEKWLFQMNGTPIDEIAGKHQITLKVDGNADLSGADVADLYEGKH